jgi:peptide chain release factor 2
MLQKIEELEGEAERLGHLLRCRDARDLADAYVLISSLKFEGPPIGAVPLLARLYRGLAERRRLAVEVLSERLVEKPREDALILLVSGPGAYALLAGENGLHQFKKNDAKGRSAREVARVEVLACPEEELPRSELKVDARPIKNARGRLLRKPAWNLELRHPATMSSLRAAVAGSQEESLAQLAPLIAALARRGSEDAPAVLRHYTLGPAPLVRDLRTGRSTGLLDQVLEGRLEPFLTEPG